MTSQGLIAVATDDSINFVVNDNDVINKVLGESEFVAVDETFNGNIIVSGLRLQTHLHKIVKSNNCRLVEKMVCFKRGVPKMALY